MSDYITPSRAKQLKRLALARYGLIIANQGNPYWTRRDAMQFISLIATCTLRPHYR